MRRFQRLKRALFVCVTLPACWVLAQDAESPKAFLRSVYARYYRNGPGVEIGGPHASRYFHSSLIALIREDSRAVDGVGVLDGDPICGCQDWDGIFNLKIDVHELKPGRAEAFVSFGLFENAKPGDIRSLVITLAQEKGAWRIYDSLDRSDPGTPFDLRTALEKEIRESKQNAKPSAP